MYIPSAFREDDVPTLHGWMRESPLANLVTATNAGLYATALPLYLDENEGPYGTLYGHLARPNSQWQLAPKDNALAIFMGSDAYVSPSWYPSKRDHGKVVPTWNYTSVQAHGPIEFFHDEEILLHLVTRLTEQHEGERPEPWAVTDAPEAFINAQLRGIVGLRMLIVRLEGKKKLSQNRPAADREGIAEHLATSDHEEARDMAKHIPTTRRARKVQT